eukprot:222108_1
MNDALFAPECLDESHLMQLDLSNIYGLWIYNNHSNTWNKVIGYPNVWDPMCYESTFNKNANKLYLYGKLEQMTIIDRKTTQKHKFKIIKPCFATQLDETTSVNTDGVIQQISPLYISNGPHINNPNHWSWNDGILQFAETHKFHFNINTLGATMVYIPKYKSVLIIAFDSLLRYSLINNKWTKYDTVKVGMGDMVAAVTVDQKYIVLKGFKWTQDAFLQRNGNIAQIKVLDIKDENKYVLRDKQIEIGIDMGITFGWKWANIFLDEMLVIRWINDVFILETVSNFLLPPTCIVELIGRFYSGEMIHYCVSDGKIRKENHFAINVADILQVTN